MTMTLFWSSLLWSTLVSVQILYSSGWNFDSWLCTHVFKLTSHSLTHCVSQVFNAFKVSWVHVHLLNYYLSAVGSKDDQEFVLHKSVQLPQKHLHHGSDGIHLHPGRRHGQPRYASKSSRHDCNKQRWVIHLEELSLQSFECSSACAWFWVCRRLPLLGSDINRNLSLSVCGNQLLCDSGQTQCLTYSWRPGLRNPYR